MSVQSSNQFELFSTRQPHNSLIVLVGNSCIFESMSWEYVSICTIYEGKQIVRQNMRVEVVEEIAQNMLKACAEIRKQQEIEKAEYERKRAASQ